MAIDAESIVGRIKETKEWDRLETQRRKAKRRRIYAWFIGLGILFVGAICLVAGEFFSALSTPVVAVCTVIFGYRITHKNYSEVYKRLVVPRLLAGIVKSFEKSSLSGEQQAVSHYIQKKHIDLELLLKIPLFEKYEHKRIRSEGEDLFVGKLGDTSFQFCDFVIKRNRDIPFADQDIDLTVFKGLVFIADFHKAFEGTTTLMTRKGKIYKHQKIIGSRMRTDSIEFDRIFRVATTDEITARYLLPANMMERLLLLRKLFGGKGMAVCLHEGYLVISIHEVDSFESDGLKALDKDGIRRTYEEIKTIIDIIDLLNLNLRIWNKIAKKANRQSV